jgi:hypothetical protein
MEPMTFELARKTVKWKLCSACWGALDYAPAENGGYVVTCAKCGDETRGYVSMKTVERRRAAGYGEKREVERMLVENGYMPDPLAGKTKDDLLKDLGY